ncbi:hypothetical protein Lesp02_50190 [Lentzea sp. NBRC 105346]|uniref:hypothetical protein n=1 Tax=Lentzea sp. NBRC 105346 TaxID=3032205 RepID=UPI0024A5A3C0|nr:hypothetical protein [Lentzea sp. NBRC 105346]GLZ32831.1 hypothetical protein Lesp02_50190 [Lentzea sp. NBRC 105346]
MSGGFEVDLRVLEAHERELKTLMAALPDAAEAGASLWNPQAFGVIGMFFAQVLSNWTDDAVEYVGKVKQTGDAVAENFAGMRQEYADNEDQVAQAFGKLRDGLDGVAP